MSDTKRKFNVTLGRAYKTKLGFWSPTIAPEEYDAIMKSVELGGRLVLKFTKNKATDKSPDAYFEFISAEDNKAMETARAVEKATQGSDRGGDSI